MAIIRDMIPAFDLAQPASVDEALDLLDRHGDEAWVLAGGMDSFDWFKDRVKRPGVVVDLGGVEELTGVRATDSGIEIGAMTTLARVATDPVVRERFSGLAKAAGKVATPQIRNQGTLGGNLSQDVRCWYYRSGWPCYRAGGNICYADTPTAMNREHCILGSSRCVAVSPSDVAPALLALDAEMVIRKRGGERVVPADKFFIGPAIDITRTTVMEPGDLLTAVRVPDRFAGARFYFEKVSDRESWDFPLANVASTLVVVDDVIEDARLAVNAVAPYPVRLRAVEQRIRKRPWDEATAEMAGDLAVDGARALRHNDYKIALMRNLVRRAVRSEEVA